MISASPGEFHNKQQQINMRCGKCDRSLFDSKSSQSFGQELCKGFGPWCLWWLVEGSVASVWCLVANTKRRLGKALEFRKSHNIGFCWLSNCLLGGTLDLPWLVNVHCVWLQSSVESSPCETFMQVCLVSARNDLDRDFNWTSDHLNFGAGQCAGRKSIPPINLKDRLKWKTWNNATSLNFVL